MSSLPSSSVAAFAVAAISLTGSAAMAGPPPQVPVGQQRLTAGIQVAPTIIVDADVEPKSFVAGGLRARFGLQHLLAANFVMGVEVDLGAAWFPPSQMAIDGRSNGGAALAWQAGLLGRFIPRGHLTGPSFGLGLQVFRTKTPETPFLSLAAEPRFGWYLWNEDSFVLPEIGYAIAFVEGYQSSLSDGEPVSDPPAVHRFTVGFTYGF